MSPGSKASLGRFVDASWAALGRLLRGLGRLLGGSRAVLDTTSGGLGASWKHLGGVFVGSSSDFNAQTHSSYATYYLDQVF